MRKALTTMAVAALAVPEKGQYDCWDKKQPGFGIRVSYGGAKRWVLMFRSGGVKKRLVLGSFPAMGLSDARQAARRYLGE
ncbi:MAG TPA: Arm DNA-binding domain-containing protein, partial [Candidatus Binataceae bacterium]|nr:Arm DNA-binding domain-containing protein [Candidatus Binataceae bacterium]